MREFRITRPDLYEEGCAGHGDVTARQGLYYSGETLDVALLNASKEYPDDSCFDVQEVHRGSQHLSQVHTLLTSSMSILYSQPSRHPRTS